jgi:prepilin-type N-terminal cleavage/methylation domain-containing protein
MRTKRRAPSVSHPTRAGGFTLLELLIVVAIVLIMAGVSAPTLSRTIRNYTIRGAANQLASEIQTARAQAIKKNVNFGAVFVVLSDTTYQFFLQDTQPPGAPADYVDSQQGPIRTLPVGVYFDPTPGGTSQDDGFRFNRLGAMCVPDGTQFCDDLAGTGAPLPGPNYVGFDATAGVPADQRGALIGLTQPDTGLTRQIVVSFGGRVNVR